MAKSNKKVKRTAPKKQYDQKENRPKKKKVVKPDCNESIMMSKKLMEKKCACKKTRRNTNSTNRSLQNGKPMPSLADLEKMFEDSDENREEHTTNMINNNESLTCSAQTLANTETAMIPEVILTDLLFSPTTRTRICEQVKGILNKSTYGNDAEEITSLPQNKLQEDFDDLPTINLNPRIIDNKCSKLYDMDQNLCTENKTETCRFKDMTVPNREHESDNSLDSNKTIEYNLETPTINSNSSDLISHIFSPLPSTSRDDTTFIKNDQLYLESLKEINNNKIKENPPKPVNEISPKQEIPPKLAIEDTDVKIEINDKIAEVQPINLETNTNKDIQMIEATNETLPTITKDTQQSDTYDDDCVIIETATEIIEVNNESVDVKHNFIQPQVQLITDTPEIIDVDALIAKNRSILNKYATPHSNRSTLNRTLVVDVDISTLTENVNDRKSLGTITHDVDVNVSTNAANVNQRTTNNQSSANEIENLDMTTTRQSPTCNLQAVTNVLIEHSRNSNLFRHSDNECEIVDITEDLSYVSPFPRPWTPVSNRRAQEFPIGNSSTMTRNSPRSTSNTKRHRQRQLQNSYESSNHFETRIQSPVQEYSETQLKSTEVLGDCPICLDKLSRGVIGSTICGHLFCMNCLEKSVKTNKKCPTCRKPLKKDGYHKIFL